MPSQTSKDPYTMHITWCIIQRSCFNEDS